MNSFFEFSILYSYQNSPCQAEHLIRGFVDKNKDRPPKVNVSTVENSELIYNPLGLTFDLVFISMDESEINRVNELSNRFSETSPRTPIIFLLPHKSYVSTLNNLCHQTATLDDINDDFLAEKIYNHSQQHTYLSSTPPSLTIDALTGLGNRRGVFEHLNHAIEYSQLYHSELVLLYINCDNFNVINESLGYRSGDLFLSSFAGLLRSTVAESDYLARVTADEFMIVINSNTDALDIATRISQKILQASRNGVFLSTGEFLEIPCSIGVTLYTPEREHLSAENLMREARIALNSVKNRGGNAFKIFHSDLGRIAARRINLLNKIRNAFQRQEFYLNYQPIMDASTDRVRGFEALLRWQLPDGERIPPNEFIPILEETGMIHVLGSWVITQACEDLSRMIQLRVIDNRHWMSVNVSPIQLLDHSFTTRLQQSLSQTQINPSQLHIELTESSLMENSEFTLATLADIKQIGCHLSLDDFGVGYSSMNYLRILPIDTLKIDQSFIRNYEGDQSDKAIIRTMVSLAHNLSKKVVAEGVETKKVANFLKQRRCDYLQGYLYAKPMSFPELVEFTQAKNHAPKAARL